MSSWSESNAARGSKACRRTQLLVLWSEKGIWAARDTDCNSGRNLRQTCADRSARGLGMHQRCHKTLETLHNVFETASCALFRTRRAKSMWSVVSKTSHGAECEVLPKQSRVGESLPSDIPVDASPYVTISPPQQCLVTRIQLPVHNNPPGTNAVLTPSQSFLSLHLCILIIASKMQFLHLSPLKCILFITHAFHRNIQDSMG